MTDREAYIILNLVSGIGPVRLRKLVDHFGKPTRILEVSVKELSSVYGISGELATEICAWKEKTGYEKEFSLAERAGVKIITKIDDEYPVLLKEIADAPICIYVRGELDPKNNQNIGIVGSRRISNYGRNMAEYLSQSAVFAGWTVISGLAFGIDAVAHKAAVDAGGKTVAVLGGGLGRIFPQEHVGLAKRIIESGGAVISEFPMEFKPNRNSFPMRNRVISGISMGTLVVEAGISSGSLITAKFALEQNRQVFAVPGQADNAQARGCNSLIKQGAKLTESFDDVLEEFDFLPGFEPKNLEKGETQEETSDDVPALGEDESKILAVLEKGETSADTVSAETGIAPGKLLALMMQLEMMRKVVQLPGRIFSLKRTMKRDIK